MTLGVVLAVASIAMLIFYIHHVATHIQADTLIDAIYAELGSLMDRFLSAGDRRAGRRRSPEVRWRWAPRTASTSRPLPGTPNATTIFKRSMARR